MNVTVLTKYVCGIDLHARKMSCCVMDIQGAVLIKKNIRCELDKLMEFIKPWIEILLLEWSPPLTGIGL